ncbi:MAG: PhoPQ-activated pathogenicity-related family protein [Pirellulales bacterium]|nr:PhoPQ-activated pathogenicity-related family protein [Pirellulales bacterium]
MKVRLLIATIAIPLLTFCLTAAVFAKDLPRRTALDDYIEKPDDSYSWKIVSSKTVDGMKTIVVDMVSQTWRTKKDVNRPEWRHWLTISIPDKVTSDIGMLFIGGGSNDKGPRSDKRIKVIAKATGTVVAELGMVPNQPLIFHNDGKKRTEDDLIGYTWDQFLKTGDPTWPARNPMVKSAVRAMDTITAVMNSAEGGKHKVDRFVVAGGSKRGWTTWLTGAVDDRVVGIIPIVIDVLNTNTSMRHHFAVYGFWAPSIGDYVSHKIMQRMDQQRIKELYSLVDPYFYRHRLTMPKLILNAAGDQFFLPDSSKFYWDDLRGENYLRYVPNGDHGLDDTDAVESIIAFYSLILAGKKPPAFQWSEDEDGTLRVLTRDKPKEVRLWQAHNPEARDFRVETLGRKYTSTVIRPDENGLYKTDLAKPDKGWTAYFLELTYDVGAPTPLKLTTNVKVIPDTVPFAYKPSNLPTSVTLICTAPNESVARKIVAESKMFLKNQDLAAGKLNTHIDGKRCYFNWVPKGNLQAGAMILTKYLSKQQCDKFTYQLESGPEITLPPAAAK